MLRILVACGEEYVNLTLKNLSRRILWLLENIKLNKKGTISSVANRVLYNSLHERVLDLIDITNPEEGINYYVELLMTRELLAGVSMEEITFKYYDESSEGFAYINEELDSDYRFELWKEFKEYSPDRKFNALSNCISQIFEKESQDIEKIF